MVTLEQQAAEFLLFYLVTLLSL